MINEVRIYDGEGNLKATVMPELAFDNMKKFQPHLCKNTGCGETTTNRHYCSQPCRVAVKMRKEKAKRAEKKRLEALKPKRLCSNEGCEVVLDSSKKKFCTKKCASDAGRDSRHKKADETKRELKNIRESGAYFKGDADEKYR